MLQFANFLDIIDCFSICTSSSAPLVHQYFATRKTNILMSVQLIRGTRLHDNNSNIVILSSPSSSYSHFYVGSMEYEDMYTSM